MQYRIDKYGLMDRLSAWNDYLKRRVRLIACGGTALNIKDTTKDIDLLVPDVKEYEYLIKVLQQLGYKPVSGWGLSQDDGFIFDLFKGRSVHTTELLDSPIEKDRHIPIKEFSRIYLGVLNYYDLIISKLFRASAVDLQDCLTLFKSKRKEINLKYLEKRFYETASYDVSEEKVIKNWKHFLKLIETA